MNKIDYNTLIPLLIPMVIYLLRVFFPNTPKVLLPILAAAGGVGMDAAAAKMLDLDFNALQGAILGLAGVGVREIKSQGQKSLTALVAGDPDEATKPPPPKPPVGLYLLLLGTCLSPLVLTTGCLTGSTPGQAAWATALAQTTEGIIQTGATIDIAVNPQHRPAYQTAQTSIGLLVHGTNYNMAEFIAAMEKLPIKQFDGPNGTVIISSTFGVWQALTGILTLVTKDTYAPVFMNAAYNGLTKALAATATTAARRTETAASAKPRVLKITRTTKI